MKSMLILLHPAVSAACPAVPPTAVPAAGGLLLGTGVPAAARFRTDAVAVDAAPLPRGAPV